RRGLRRDGDRLVRGAGADHPVLRRVPALPRGRRRNPGPEGLRMSMTRRSEARAAAREARSGAGPVDAAFEPGAHPGATAKFGLFGEVLTAGLLIALVALPVVTLPISLAAGVRHMRRFAAAEDSRVALFW